MSPKRYQIQSPIYRNGEIVDWGQCRHQNKQRMNYITLKAAQKRAQGLAKDTRKMYRVFDLVTQKSIKIYYR